MCLEREDAFHFCSVPKPASCCLTCLLSWPGHLSNGKTFLNYQRQREERILKNTRTPTQSHWHAPCTQTPSPFPRILEHTTHPAPAVASHPHASPGLGVLWTPHTSVSANLCSLSLHTPLTKACQDVSTGTQCSQHYVQF